MICHYGAITVLSSTKAGGGSVRIDPFETVSDWVDPAISRTEGI